LRGKVGCDLQSLSGAAGAKIGSRQIETRLLASRFYEQEVPDRFCRIVSRQKHQAQVVIPVGVGGLDAESVAEFLFGRAEFFLSDVDVPEVDASPYGICV